MRCVYHIRVQHGGDAIFRLAWCQLFEARGGETEQTAHGTTSEPEIACRANICKWI